MKEKIWDKIDEKELAGKFNGYICILKQLEENLKDARTREDNLYRLSINLWGYGDKVYKIDNNEDVLKFYIEEYCRVYHNCLESLREDLTNRLEQIKSLEKTICEVEKKTKCEFKEEEKWKKKI